jgi:tetratricopeptide (TPR) repeat protein
MKKHYTIAILICSICLSGQVNRFDSPMAKPTEFMSLYVPIDREAFRQMAEAVQKRRDDYVRYKSDMLEVFQKIRLQEQDSELSVSLDELTTTLLNIPNDGISQRGNDLQRIWETFKSTMDAYYKVKPQRVWTRAQQKFQSRDFKGALSDFEFFLAGEKTEPSVNYYLAWCNYYLENLDVALENASRFVKLGEPNPDMFYLNANLLFKKGEFIAALPLVSKMLDLEESEAGYFLRARIKSSLGDQYGSISDNSKAIALSRGNPSMAYNNRGWSKFILKQFPEALADLDIALQNDPKNATAYDSRAETKFMLKDYKGSIEDCDRALKLDPKLSNSYIIRGNCLLKLGKRVDACLDWSQAGEIGNTTAYDLIGLHCNK